MDKIVFESLNALHFPHRDYVLALPGWYPTWQDPYPGDFNQRHILAAGTDTPQVVLYISKDLSGLLLKTEVRCRLLTDKIVEIVAIYPTVKWFDAIRSNVRFFYLLEQFTGMIRLKFGKPLLIHSYIVVRGGLAGRWLSARWKVPLVLTENWTIYYPEDPGFLRRRNPVFRRAVSWVFNGVSVFLPVTYSLQQQVSKVVGPIRSIVIPNVVDTTTFYPASVNNEGVFTFIHISTMGYQKNPEGLLRAFRKFSVSHRNARLMMVGPASRSLEKFAGALGFEPGVVGFAGSVSYTAVADLLRNAHALVLFSRYENLPCVVLEALCTGLPVISTDVGGIGEVINDQNGRLVTNGDEAALVDAFTRLFETYDEFDRARISERARRLFSYGAVGKQISAVYAGLNQPYRQ